ncbi:unnamed protein product [Angiostrongylus costaricensis]|uniref:Uncharacterized protein n=1 Tax=Angiostrongylus costaricensis TaxID=334426 RepID=A0A0R3PYD4_ANGCS|nr:unnamed protein product [Angiostrongylus costaricensis]
MEVSETVTDEPSKTENVYWDTAPLLQDVLNSASDNIVLGSNGDGDEEGAFVVHEDIGRSYEYQSDAVGSSSVVRLLYATFFLLVWNNAF